VGLVSGGTVARLEQAQVANLQVTVEGSTASTTVNSDGSFAIGPVPPGDQLLEILSADGNTGADVVVSVLPGDTITVAGQISVVPVGGVQGNVTNSAGGGPLAGAEISVAPAAATELLGQLPNGRPVFHTITDANGSYQVRGLPAGPYLVIARDHGFQLATQSVTVVAGQRVEADFSLTAVPGTGTVAGNVTTTENGQTVPARDALVLLSNQVAPPPPPPVSPPGTPVPVAASNAADDSGDALTTSQVVTELPPVPSTGPAILFQPLFAWTNSQGYFELDGVAPGTYSLFVVKLGDTTVSQSVQVVADQTVDLSVTLVQNTGQITGQVTGANTGQPLARAGVLAQLAGDPFGPPVPGVFNGPSVGGSSPPSIAIFPPLRRFALTDSSGNYGIPLLFPGNYEVSAFKPEFTESSQSATVSAAQSTTVNFQLTPLLTPPPGTSLGALLSP
jgi:hypothetical protein